MQVPLPCPNYLLMTPSSDINGGILLRAATCGIVRRLDVSTCTQTTGTACTQADVALVQDFEFSCLTKLLFTSCL